MNDLQGVDANGVDGLAFITNQELSLSERSTLKNSTQHPVEIFHLDRIAAILDSPSNYGIRLEFLDIGLTIEEQLSFFAKRDLQYKHMADTLERLEKFMEFTNKQGEESGEDDYEPFEVRTNDMISEIIEELFDKIWHERHLVLKYKVENGLDTVDPKIWADALAAAKRVQEKYGRENLGPYDDFEWGMLNGKLSALRWVLGDEWDFLDT
ncbi:hypothetical protein L2D08_06930 [Domibacillus sp. PGB-M46]|uniref:hypothetical protein n=1 Tax=Domibacillus sp. PGB-M46 TaxID=2910255 RepID=UPI001F5A18D8|nr:hypothetical protein [Domibacillus sp. PGB-M46]MCI2254095.1 hypothetical protein [Domibacillus sp. PGB-M46]